MRNTASKKPLSLEGGFRPGEVPGEWERRLARREELTARQRQVLALCYDRGLSVTEAARELGVCPSTVSRTLQRARHRLYRCLRYGL